MVVQQELKGQIDEDHLTFYLNLGTQSKGQLILLLSDKLNSQHLRHQLLLSENFEILIQFDLSLLIHIVFARLL